MNRTRNTKITSIFLVIAVTMGISVFAFQNCDVRRIDTTNNFSAGGIGQPNWNPTGSSPTPGPTTGPTQAQSATPTATPAQSCLKDAANNVTFTGISNFPQLRSSYAMVTRTDMTSYKATSLTILTMGSCTSETDLTRVQTCATPGPTPTCTDHTPNSFITLSLVCDGASATATSCSNFASYLNQNINLSDAQWSGKISISVSYIGDPCDSTKTSTLLPPFSSPTGSIKITSLANLSTGTVVTVQFTGVQVNSFSGPTRSGTLNGTISGKILSIPAPPTCS